MWITKLDVIANKYDNAYHRTMKMGLVAVKPSTYIESSKEIYYQDSKFKIGDIARISKYKNIFAKGYVLNWSEEVFVIKNLKNTAPWTHVINDFKGGEIAWTFYNKELQKKKKSKKSCKKQIKKSL